MINKLIVKYIVSREMLIEHSENWEDSAQVSFNNVVFSHHIATTQTHHSTDNITKLF